MGGTLSVAAGSRGTARASVRAKEIVPRQRLIDFEATRRNDLNNWLSAVRAVIEGRAPWPATDMAPGLRQACMARPPIVNPLDASASALISADPATVWDAVQSPETARVVGPSPPIFSGCVPGTPRGEAGEMQYFVNRRENGQVTVQVAVIFETSGQRSTLTHFLRPLQLEQNYLLTPESKSGPTRLDLTYRWPAPKLPDAAEAARNNMAEALQAIVTDYKSVIEAGSGGASAKVPVRGAG